MDTLADLVVSEIQEIILRCANIEPEWWFFVGAGVTALLIAWIIIGMLTIKAARINPAECIRNE